MCPMSSRSLSPQRAGVTLSIFELENGQIRGGILHDSSGTQNAAVGEFDLNLIQARSLNDVAIRHDEGSR